MELSIGQEAPSISLYNSEKEKVSLDDFKGKNVLILFFPLAFSSVCTKELCSVRDNITVYNSFDAQVLGISVDSLYVLNRYKQEQSLNVPLLSDFNKHASKAFGVLYDIFPSYEMEGVSKRAAFLIDKEGIIRLADVCERPADLPDFEAIQKALASLS